MNRGAACITAPGRCGFRGQALLLLGVLLLSGSPVGADSGDVLTGETIARLDGLLGEVSAEDPGAALVVVHLGGIAYENYRGQANLEWRAPIGPNSRFYLGSLSKQFTAGAAMVLIRDGVLDPDKPARALLSELPAYTREVTVRDLLHHTSGLRDYLKIRQMAGLPDERPFGNPSVLQVVARQKHLVFPAGTRYQYSNTNYVLLAEIISRVTGEQFVDFVRHSVFEPAGMQNTVFETDPHSVLPRRVESYRTPAGQPSRRYFKLFSAVGDGGAYSTPHDLARWLGILLRRDTLDAAFLEQFLQPDGRVPGNSYAHGLHVRELRGIPVIEHGGSMLGFEHWQALFPRQGLAFVLLTNDKAFDPVALRGELAEILLDDALAPTERAQAVVVQHASSDKEAPELDLPPLPETVLGRYHNDEIPVDLTLERGAEGLLVTPSTFRTVPARRIAARRIEAMGGALQIEIRDHQGRPVLVARLPDLGLFEFRQIAADQTSDRITEP